MSIRNKKINYDYMKVLLEPLILIRAQLKINNKSVVAKSTGRILVIDTCLIGDFMASLPALSIFLRKNKNLVDLVVSPSLEQLARKIRGVGQVITARSVYARSLEKRTRSKIDLAKYDQIILMRASKDVYELLKKADTNAQIKSASYIIMRYGLSLVWNNILRKIPKQWREVNFEILNVPVANLKFEEIFDFGKSDYFKIKKMKEMIARSKILIIHTGSSWSMNMWDNDRWVELINRLNESGKFRFIFVGAKNEEGDYKYIKDKLKFKVYSLIGRINLLELMLVLRSSDYFIGVDSGPRNMAHVADLRSVVLLGPGPHMFMPISKKDIVLDKSRGRGLFQRFFYKKKSFIKNINADEVYKAFIRLANRKS